MRWQRGWIAWVVVMGGSIAPAGVEAADRGGIGVLGDSYSDEYRFYPPDCSSARNWVEVLAEVRGLNFGAFSERSRGEPRNQGYAYNWARSDAETGDLIARGQHTGLAEQVRRGEVDTVVMIAGGNDFIHALQSDDPDGVLEATAERAEGNYREAVRTILEASPQVQMLLVTLPDILELPEFEVQMREGRLPGPRAAAYRAAVRRFNEAIRGLAATEPRLAVLDMERVARLTLRLGPDHVLVAGKILERTSAANDADHLFLGDERHMGGFGQAFLAKLIVDALDASFKARIEPLGLQEVYALAQAGRTSGAAVAAGALDARWSLIGLGLVPGGSARGR